MFQKSQCRHGRALFWICVLLTWALVSRGADCGSLAAVAAAWWRFESNLLDSVSTNHGWPYGASTYSSGKIGQAFAFDGNSRIEVPDGPASAFGTNDFTIALWANFADSGGRRPFIASDNGGGSQDKWIFWLDQGNIVFHINGSSAYGDLGVVPFAAANGAWHHI